MDKETVLSIYLGFAAGWQTASWALWIYEHITLVVK